MAIALSRTFREEQREIAAKWSESSNILVVVRCRPMSEAERRAREEDVVSVVDGAQVIVRDPGHTAVNDMRKARVRDRLFAFDHAFAQQAPSERVYALTTRFLIDGVVAGFNATVFAYGATGSGKTYTMLGSRETPGLMVLTLRDLYGAIERATRASAEEAEAARAQARAPSAGPKRGGGRGARLPARLEYRVSLSYVEVYNENIRDLLSDSGAADVFLDLREDPLRGNCVAGVSEHSVASTGDVMELLSAGNRRRTQEPTAANRESSRSHAVLQIHVSQRACEDAAADEERDPFAGLRLGVKGGGVEGKRGAHVAGKGGAKASHSISGSVKVGKFSLIDLAGSERAANTRNSGIRLIEGANINRSLLALGNCITALVQGKGSFVPYRDSKLTRLLKDSLGGNCRTVMISCISPAAAAFEESCNTLKYANRAKNIRTNIARNKVDVVAHVAEYETLISGLRSEVATLKHKLAATGGGAGGLLGGTLGGALLSPIAAAMRHASQPAVVAGAAVSAAALASPALKKSGVGRSISPIQSPDERATSSTEPQGSPAGGAFRPQCDAFWPVSENFLLENNVPSGFVLVNVAEAAAAAEKLRSLRETLVNNFQDRMQIQRSLIELQAQAVQNHAEIGRREAGIARWEHALGDDRVADELPLSPAARSRVASKAAAAAARHEIQELKKSMVANAKTKELLVARLEDSSRQSEAIRAQLDLECNTDERRELLGLEYRVCLLELEKVELEQSSLLSSHVLDAQRIEVRKLKIALRARDRDLAAQAALLKQHGIPFSAVDEGKVGEDGGEESSDFESGGLGENAEDGRAVNISMLEGRHEWMRGGGRDFGDSDSALMPQQKAYSPQRAPAPPPIAPPKTPSSPGAPARPSAHNVFSPSSRATSWLEKAVEMVRKASSGRSSQQKKANPQIQPTRVPSRDELSPQRLVLAPRMSDASGGGARRATLQPLAPPLPDSDRQPSAHNRSFTPISTIEIHKALDGDNGVPAPLRQQVFGQQRSHAYGDFKFMEEKEGEDGEVEDAKRGEDKVGRASDPALELRRPGPPPQRNKAVWLSDLPPHRPVQTKALQAAKAAEIREAREREKAAEVAERAHRATDLKHAALAYGGAVPLRALPRSAR